MIIRLGIQRDVDQVVNTGVAMFLGLGLTSLALLLVLKVTPGAASFTREGLALALAIILLGFLMMIIRRNAVTQIVGFMSLENGLILAATGARGMPLVVEVSVAFSVLIALFVFAVSFSVYGSALTTSTSSCSSVSGESAVMNQAVYAVVGIPFLSAILLAIIPSYRVTAIGNVLASGLTFAAGLSFLALPPVVKNYVILDDLNVFFIILNTLVAFTTSVFSGSYIEHEIERAT